MQISEKRLTDTALWPGCLANLNVFAMTGHVQSVPRVHRKSRVCLASRVESIVQKVVLLRSHRL